MSNDVEVWDTKILDISSVLYYIMEVRYYLERGNKWWSTKRVSLEELLLIVQIQKILMTMKE